MSLNDTLVSLKITLVSLNNAQIGINSSWTEWSTIQRVIGQVISKSEEHTEQHRFEITSKITS